MSSQPSHVAEVAGAPSGPRFDLEPPVAVVTDEPPPVVVHHGVSVSHGSVAANSEPVVEHHSGFRNIAMTPYGGSLAAVSSDLGDNW